MGPLKQDDMREKLAQWKAEKAERKRRLDEERRETEQGGRQPLKRLRPSLPANSVNAVKQHGPTPDRREMRSEDSCSDSKSSTPGQVMTMREKLELWRRKKQASAQKPPSSSAAKPTESTRRAPPKSHARSVATPSSSSRPRPPAALDAAKSREAGADSAKGGPVETPTPARGAGLGADRIDRSGPARSKAVFVSDNGRSEGRSTPAVAARRTESGDRPPAPRKSLGVRGNTVATPARCSPRLLEQGRGSSVQAQAPLGTTPKATPKAAPMPWQDKQMDMKNRLEHWLTSKGKTPSRYGYLLDLRRATTPADDIRRQAASERRRRRLRAATTPRPVWRLDPEPSSTAQDSRGSPGDELTSALSGTMEECFLLLKSGCPTAHISEWLDNLVSKVPAMRQCAKYWLCRVAIAREEGQDANEIINIYEEAVREGPKPIGEVKASLQKYVAELVDSPASPQLVGEDLLPINQPVPDPGTKGAGTPRRIRAPAAAVEHLLQSTVLKYCLTESTPYFDRIRTAVGESGASASLVTPRLQLVTPVRRSTRLEGRRSALPLGLQEHDLCLASLDLLPSSGGPREFILRTNRALNEEFAEEDEGQEENDDKQAEEEENLDQGLGSL